MVGSAAVPREEVTSSKSIAKRVANDMNLEAPRIAIFNFTLLSLRMEWKCEYISVRSGIYNRDEDVWVRVTNSCPQPYSLWTNSSLHFFTLSFPVLVWCTKN